MRYFVKMGRAWWLARSESTRSLLQYIGRALWNYLSWGAGSRQAAALSYYVVFSVFPLILLLAVAISSLVGPAIAQEQIATGLSLFLPEATVADIQVTLGRALERNTEFGLVASLGLFWSATGLFTNITLALDTIFQVPALRSIWRQRLLAVVMSMTLVVLVLASFVTSGVLRLISALLLDRPNIWLSISSLFLPLGLNLVIFALLFRYVPARYVYWDAVWPAAMFGAIGWELAKSAFEWYLANFVDLSAIYGSIATGIALLFWAYLIASIFLISAELCARINEWIVSQESPPSDLWRASRPPTYFQNAAARSSDDA